MREQINKDKNRRVKSPIEGDIMYGTHTGEYEKGRQSQWIQTKGCLETEIYEVPFGMQCSCGKVMGVCLNGEGCVSKRGMPERGRASYQGGRGRGHACRGVRDCVAGEIHSCP